MWRDGLSRDDALRFIREKRPRIGPHAVYLDYLLEWEMALKKDKR